jgi:hypothetical protein
MAQNTPQNFGNHARLLPPFHFVVLPILTFYLLWTLYQAVTAFSWERLAACVVAFALVLMALLGRMMALSVQDRVIRLEERMRMRELLPADLQPRIPEFTVKQLVAIRFASDEELPALARKVLDDKIVDQKAIKQMVKHWRADYQRA